MIVNNNSPDMKVELNSLTLQNPVITASGTFGYGDEVKNYFNPNSLGAITVKGLSVKPTQGNPTPRIAETPAGILNSIGLENPGLEKFIENKLEIIKDYEVPVIANISGHSIDDFKILAEKLAPYQEISALEVNVSCPNIKGGGMAFGTDSELIYQITQSVKKLYKGTVIIKLSPNVTDIVEMATAAQSAGADIISLINTLLGMAIDINKQKPVLGNTFGGLSGPAIKPVALRMVYQVARAVDIPIIGMGGIMSGEDAIEFILAGAHAVGIGTATLVEPDASLRIINEIKEYMIKNNVNSISDLTGNANKK